LKIAAVHNTLYLTDWQINFCRPVFEKHKVSTVDRDAGLKSRRLIAMALIRALNKRRDSST